MQPLVETPAAVAQPQQHHVDENPSVDQSQQHHVDDNPGRLELLAAAEHHAAGELHEQRTTETRHREEAVKTAEENVPKKAKH